MKEKRQMEPNKNEREMQIERLINFINTNGDSREMKRALAVKLALEGYAYRAINKILNVSQGYVSKWKKRFIKQGIKGLRLGYKGARTKLNKEEEEETIKWLLCQEYWDISELEIYLIEEYDVVFESKESYYKIYRQANITRQKAEKVNPRKNEEKVKQRNEEINQILEEHREEIESEKLVVYAIDECHLMGGDIVGEVWGKSKERVKIPISNYRDRQTYYGALNLSKPDLILEKYETGNGENTVKFVKSLQNKNPGKRLLLFWDGVRHHTGENMQKFLEKENQGLAKSEWKITCELFAPYAPEENPVEAIWFQLKSLLRRFYRFGKNFKIINLLFEFFAKYNLFNFPNLKKFDAFSQFI
jgi:transposase